MIDKIFIFGMSTVDPCFFNRRVLDKKEPDPGSFAELVGIFTNCNNIKVFEGNCPGNEWLSSCVINQLDNMTENSLVIVQWAAMDVFDILTDGSISNEDIGVYDATGLHPRALRNKEFFQTFDFDGNEKNDGIRFWSPGPTQKNPARRKHFNNILLNNVYGVKQSCEKISLVQHLLKERSIKQYHFTSTHFESLCYSYVKTAVKFYDYPVEHRAYVYSEFDAEPVHIEELDKWYKLIDYNIFLEPYINFFVDRHIPYWPTPEEMRGPFHQPPINNYIFLKEQIFKDSAISFFDKAVELNKQHCDQFSINYDEVSYETLRARFDH